MSEETLDAPHQTEGDTKEGLYFGREVPPDAEEAHMPLHGPNQWPAQASLQLPDVKHAAVGLIKPNALARADKRGNPPVEPSMSVYNIDDMVSERPIPKRPPPTVLTFVCGGFWSGLGRYD